MVTNRTLPVVEGPDGLRLALPPGWRRLAHEDGLALGVEDWPHEGRLRPTLTAVVTPATPETADVRGLGAVAVAAARARTGTHVISYDVWTGPEGLTGRCLRHARPTPEGHVVVVVQWLFVQGGLVCAVTGQVDVGAAETTGPSFEQALDGLRLPAAGPGPVPDPVALDPFLAELGEEMEDLAVLGAPEPYRPHGPEIGQDTLAALARARARSARPRRLPSEARAELTRAGLLGPDGRWTEAGGPIAGLLAAPAVRLRLEAKVDGVPLAMECFAGAEGSLLVSTLSPGEVRARPPLSGGEVQRITGRARLHRVEQAFVPLALASWLGLGPAWSVVTSPADLSLMTVTGRGEDPEVPPPAGADASLSDLWRRAWFLWTLATSAPGAGMFAVDAGPRGQFAVTKAPGSGDVGLHAYPSAAVWSALVENVSRAFAPRR